MVFFFLIHFIYWDLKTFHFYSFNLLSEYSDLMLSAITLESFKIYFHKFNHV